MNTLTKILIVLLTTSSMFLCGLVATYVANADNYMQLYNSTHNQLTSVQAEADRKTREANDKVAQAVGEQEKLQNRIVALETTRNQLDAALTNAERDKAQLNQRFDGFAATVDMFTQTNDNQGKLLENAIANWKSAEAGLLSEQGRHKETIDALESQIVIATNLEQQNRRLKEEMAGLQGQLDTLLGRYGKAVALVEPVTQVTAQARPAEPATREIGLKGQITAVDLNNSVAVISIGATHGVKKNMKFLVIRDERFICNILISDVEADKAVGDLSLIQEPPRIGDEVSTNL